MAETPQPPPGVWKFSTIRLCAPECAPRYFARALSCYVAEQGD